MRPSIITPLENTSAATMHTNWDGRDFFSILRAGCAACISIAARSSCIAILLNTTSVTTTAMQRASKMANVRCLP